MYCRSRSVFLPRLPVVGAVPLAAVQRRQRSVLRDNSRMGCMQWHLGDTYLRHADINPHQSYHEGGRTVAIVPFPRSGHHFSTAHIHLRISQNTDIGDTVGHLFAAVCGARGALGGATQIARSVNVTQCARITEGLRAFDDADDMRK